jgi:hypothetical protein
MIKEPSMETRKAILNFQNSEKMKSELVIGTPILHQMEDLKSEEAFSGGNKV